MKKHSARVDATGSVIISSAQEEEDHDRAQLGGDESDDHGSESYENVDEDGQLINEKLVRDHVETCVRCSEIKFK